MEANKQRQNSRAVRMSWGQFLSNTFDLKAPGVEKQKRDLPKKTIFTCMVELHLKLSGT